MYSIVIYTNVCFSEHLLVFFGTVLHLCVLCNCVLHVYSAPVFVFLCLSCCPSLVSSNAAWGIGLYRLRVCVCVCVCVCVRERERETDLLKAEIFCMSVSAQLRFSAIPMYSLNLSLSLSLSQYLSLSLSLFLPLTFHFYHHFSFDYSPASLFSSFSPYYSSRGLMSLIWEEDGRVWCPTDFNFF